MKSQSALEFVVLSTFMLLVIVGFFAITTSRMFEARDEIDMKTAQDLAELAFNEIEIATSVNDGYTRVFNIPRTVNGVNYTITIIDNRELIINYLGKEYIKFLPTNVSGNITKGLNQIKKDKNWINLSSVDSQCENDFDDDKDGLVDKKDPGCYSGCSLNGNYMSQWSESDSCACSSVGFCCQGIGFGSRYVNHDLSCSGIGSCWTTCLGNSTLTVKDGSSRAAIFIDDGNLMIRGTLQENGNPILTSSDELVFKQGSANLAVINLVTGNVVIKGTLRENRNVINSAGGQDEFVFKSSSGQIMSMIDQGGDLSLKGILIQNGGVYLDGVGVPGGDVGAPAISGVSASGLLSNSATITWATDENSDSQVQYGVTTSYGSSTTLDINMVTSHSVSLSGLLEGTLYHYRVKSKDITGNLATSSDYTFTTPFTDTTPPIGSNGQPSGSLAPGTTSTTVSLSTNEAATCRYSTTANTAYASMTGTFTTTGGISHSMVVSGLTNGQTYNYYVRCSDTFSNINGNDFTISFSVLSDSVPPIRSAGSPVGALALGTTSTAISLSTNEAATCRYSTTANTAYASMTGTFTTTGSTSHSRTVTGLTNGQNYKYYVRCSDTLGNANTNDYLLNFSVPQTLFTTQTPAGTNFNDGTNYNMGMRFYSTVNGRITHIRYYKAPSDSGTHTGRIYLDSSQALLASVTFTGETLSGWQTQALTTPLNITANTNYLVSVNIANNRYVATTNGFSSQISNVNLRSASGSNANGRYGTPSNAFPTNFFGHNNYFRDVVFAPW